MAIILKVHFLSKDGREDLFDLKTLHARCRGGIPSPELRKLNETLDAFYPMVEEGDRRGREKAEARILDMKDMVTGYIFSGRCVTPI